MTEINSPAAVSPEARALAKPSLAQLKKATDGFETIFVKNLLTEMQKDTHMFGTGTGAGIYQDLMNQSVSESIGKTGSLGISKMLYNQMAPRILAQAEAQVKLHGNAQKGDKPSSEK